MCFINSLYILVYCACNGGKGLAACLVLSNSKMLTHWKKSITGRRVKSSVPSDGNTVADSSVGKNDSEMVDCKLCLTACCREQMYTLEQCRCSFCLEVR